MPASWKTILRDATIVLLFAAALGLGVNRVRPSGRIPWIATKSYDILVPCPEYQGHAAPLTRGQVPQLDRDTTWVDARSINEYAAWHMPGALFLPFDYLAPTSADSVRRVLNTKSRRIIVYGDGEEPDSGEQLAQELSSKGIRNIFFLKGGAPVLRLIPGPVERKQP